MFFTEEREKAAVVKISGATFNPGPPGATFHPGPALSLRAVSIKVNQLMTTKTV